MKEFKDNTAQAEMNPGDDREPAELIQKFRGVATRSGRQDKTTRRVDNTLETSEGIMGNVKIERTAIINTGEYQRNDKFDSRGTIKKRTNGI